jgi:hypothetical protein
MEDNITIVIENTKYFINDPITEDELTFTMSTDDLETRNQVHSEKRVDNGAEFFRELILRDPYTTVEIYVNDYMTEETEDFFQNLKNPPSRSRSRAPPLNKIYITEPTRVLFTMNANQYLALHNDIDIDGFMMGFFDKPDFQKKITNELSDMYGIDLHHDIIQIADGMNSKRGKFSVIPINYTVHFPSGSTMQIQAICKEDLLKEIKKILPQKKVHIARIVRRGIRMHDVYVVFKVEDSDVMLEYPDYDEYEFNKRHGHGTRKRRRKSKKGKKGKSKKSKSKK